jgi:hypothetical protein
MGYIGKVAYDANEKAVRKALALIAALMITPSSAQHVRYL